MNWINANLAGTRQVFTFTAAQFLKNRANLVTFVLLFVFCLVSVPLLSLLGSGSAQQALPAQSGLTQVYGPGRYLPGSALGGAGTGGRLLQPNLISSRFPAVRLSGGKPGAGAPDPRGNRDLSAGAVHRDK